MQTENNVIETFKLTAEILAEILDIAPQRIIAEAYVIRDLGAESIDLMELAVSLNERFGIEIDEEALFLKSVRRVVENACEAGVDAAAAVAEKFDFLSPQRIADILDDLKDGPVLKVKDVVQYICARKMSVARHAC